MNHIPTFFSSVGDTSPECQRILDRVKKAHIKFRVGDTHIVLSKTENGKNKKESGVEILNNPLCIHVYEYDYKTKEFKSFGISLPPEVENILKGYTEGRHG